VKILAPFRLTVANGVVFGPPRTFAWNRNHKRAISFTVIYIQLYSPFLVEKTGYPKYKIFTHGDPPTSQRFSAPRCEVEDYSLDGKQQKQQEF